MELFFFKYEKSRTCRWLPQEMVLTLQVQCIGQLPLPCDTAQDIPRESEREREREREREIEKEKGEARVCVCERERERRRAAPCGRGPW